MPRQRKRSEPKIIPFTERRIALRTLKEEPARLSRARWRFTHSKQQLAAKRKEIAAMKRKKLPTIQQRLEAAELEWNIVDAEIGILLFGGEHSSQIEEKTEERDRIENRIERLAKKTGEL